MAEYVKAPLTYWMRPPEDSPMEDGTMPGEEGYIDPHAAAMEEWRNIPYKQGTGAEYGPKKSPFKGQPEGHKAVSGNLRRKIPAQKSLITGTA